MPFDPRLPFSTKSGDAVADFHSITTRTIQGHAYVGVIDGYLLTWDKEGRFMSLEPDAREHDLVNHQ